MINYLPLSPLLVSFLITLLLLPFWIKKAKQINLLWPDMNKFSKPKVAGSGGIIAVLGFLVGVLAYISYFVFFLGAYTAPLVEIFALLNVVLILAGVAFIDDLLGWQQGGLSRRSRLILVFFAAIPLMAINAGKSSISLPFLGSTDLGILYPLFFIPIGIAGATTTFNFLAGFNGLESGQGILLLSAVGLVALFTGNQWLSIIAFSMVASLFAFIFYNFYPAKTFPGDSLTYTIGGLIAMVSILGNFEKIAVFFFIPYICETLLKSRGALKKQSFGNPKEDGSLSLRYSKIYSLTHISIFLMQKFKIKPTEKRVVYSIWIFQLIIILLGFFIFRKGIFL